MKNSKLNCIIGDVVEFDEDEKVITKIFERKNYLHRPLLSNIDFIGILFAIENPKFDFINFQKMLLNSNYQNIPCILILSKIDLVSKDELNQFLEEFLKIFGNTVRVFPISIKGNFGIKELKDYIKTREILESKNSTNKTLINYIECDDISNIVKNILIPAWIREIEKADTEIIDASIEQVMLSSGNISNILDLLNLKRNNYKNDSSVLVMVG